MKYSNRLTDEEKKEVKRMSEQDEKLKFADMFGCIKVVDPNDRVKLLKDCAEAEFQELANKVSEYNRDGKLVITINFKRDKKSKNGIDIYADVTKTIPKGSQKNQFYLDTRNGGLYWDDPNQGKFSIVKPFLEHHSKGGQND